MSKQKHDQLHALTPVYADLRSILQLAMDGMRNGNAGLFVDIRDKANDGLGRLLDIESNITKESLDD